MLNKFEFVTSSPNKPFDSSMKQNVGQLPPKRNSNKSAAVAEMGDRDHTIDICRKEGGCCADFAGAGTPSSTMCLGRGLLPYQAAS